MVGVEQPDLLRMAGAEQPGLLCVAGAEQPGLHCVAGAEQPGQFRVARCNAAYKQWHLYVVIIVAFGTLQILYIPFKPTFVLMGESLRNFANDARTALLHDKRSLFV